MSRRDTILIAVLVNAGLLLILFAVGLKTDEEIPLSKDSHETEKQIVFSPPQKPEIIRGGDEVDQLIKQHGKEKSEPLALEKTPALQVIEEKVAPVVKEAVKEEAIETASKVTVKKGDALEKIAKRYGTTVSALMKENHLSDPRLKIGQVLTLPTSNSKPEKVSDLHTEKYYTVKNGDNPWTIAVKNHMKVEELLELNGLNAEKARHLKPGDQLRIK